MEFTSIKGFKDVLPEEVGHWQRIESVARNVFSCFGYHEIKMPLLERTELFSRSIGEETDIVSKEMYTFRDSKNRGMTLRPEATASMTRAYIQHKLYVKSPVQKLFTIGPMFRHERPQKGRFRQFHQIDVEIFGDPGPKSDADLLVMGIELFSAVGLKDLSLKLNSLGCPECRPSFKTELKSYLTDKTEGLCADCRRRAETNPLRVFDCKVEGCNRIVDNAPSVLDFCCEPCGNHFAVLQEYLDRSDISFVVDHKLVRGLDYYNRTTFEFQTERLGSQNAVTGGGRYDGLMKILGGPDHPAIGFAVGMERVVALLEETLPLDRDRPDLFIVALGEEAEKITFHWASGLRKAGLWVEIEYGAKGLKAQMKRANRLGARKVLIVGDNELESEKCVLRDMDTKEQEDVAIKNIVDNLKSKLQIT